MSQNFQKAFRTGRSLDRTLSRVRLRQGTPPVDSRLTWMPCHAIRCSFLLWALPRSCFLRSSNPTLWSSKPTTLTPRRFSPGGRKTAPETGVTGRRSVGPLVLLVALWRARYRGWHTMPSYPCQRRTGDNGESCLPWRRTAGYHRARSRLCCRRIFRCSEEFRKAQAEIPLTEDSQNRQILVWEVPELQSSQDAFAQPWGPHTDLHCSARRTCPNKHCWSTSSHSAWQTIHSNSCRPFYQTRQS